MGMDCTIAVCNKDGTAINDDICDFRSSDWFNHLIDCDGVFYYLPWRYDIPDKVSSKVQEDYDHREDGYFNFRWLTVEDWVDWFEKYRPDVTAGWMTTYDKWLYEKKHIVDTENMYRYLSHVDGNVKDYHFVEIENEYDNSRWLYNYLKQHDYDKTWNLIFYFDW